MAENSGRISPPCSPPDCPWVPMKPNTKVPDAVVHYGDKLNGEPVYIGRVYDEGDKCYLNGTVLPGKGVCLYLNKNCEVKSTDAYDILTVECRNPLEFQPMAIDHRNRFVSGGDEDRCVYTARVVDGENTYFGWADDEAKKVYIPRETSNKLDSNYDILVHTLLDRLCICPTAPTPPF